jgi:DNA-binding transcriptional regulator YdaS (Cro superfamily)
VLYRLYGTWKRVAQVLGVAETQIYRWHTQRVKHLAWGTAQRIRAAVLGDIGRRDPGNPEKRRREAENQRKRRQGLSDGTWVLRKDRAP